MKEEENLEIFIEDPVIRAIRRTRNAADLSNFEVISEKKIEFDRLLAELSNYERMRKLTF